MDKPTKVRKPSPTASDKGNSGARVKKGSAEKAGQIKARDKRVVSGMQNPNEESLPSNTSEREKIAPVIQSLQTTKPLTARARKPRGQTLIEAFSIVQLHALSELGRFMGMFGSYSSTTGLNMAEVAQRHEEPGAIANIQWALWTLLDDDAHFIQHTAAGMVLQYYWPRWREEGPPELVGRHVERDAPAVLAWRKQVLERDGNRCQHCYTTEQLHAHHIVHWAVAPMLRTVVANGITLCERCHITEHHGQ